MAGNAIKETDLCALFIACLPDTWLAYPETGGFDILLARKSDGFQIGVEAKLKLNAKVISQAVEIESWHRILGPSPDCRAVLIPAGVGGDLRAVCRALGVTVITMKDVVLDDSGIPKRSKHSKEMFYLSGGSCGYPFQPNLPVLDDKFHLDWYEKCPDQRVVLPDWIPDVMAGASAPMALTDWKIRAIKIAVTLELRGHVTRQDFAHHKISISRWIAPVPGWLRMESRGRWVAGDSFPDFRRQHPVNYEQIKADADSWIAPLREQPGFQSEAQI